LLDVEERESGKSLYALDVELRLCFLIRWHGVIQAEGDANARITAESAKCYNATMPASLNNVRHSAITATKLYQTEFAIYASPLAVLFQ